jgi:acyl-CoA hydrolase/RimJ/RimL family protein N-acetyltransferase
LAGEIRKACAQARAAQTVHFPLEPPGLERAWRLLPRRGRTDAYGTTRADGSRGRIAMYDTRWQTRYAEKLLTPEQAIRRIQPGRRILIGSGAAEPTALVEALAEHGDHLADNDIVHLLTLGSAPYVRPEFAGRFRHSAFFIGPNVREAVQAGRADFMPVFLSEIPRLIRSRRVRVDVALLQVSPPDARGYVSLGVSVDIVRAAVEAADLVLAEVNPSMPRTFGDSFVPVSEIDGLVPVETPVLELRPAPADDISLAIGRHVASLIPNGATIQTGIGRIPHAVITALAHHQDLGVHTEMLSDSLVELVLSGVVTGRKKTLLPGKIVTSFVMGTRRLYEWVNDNPAVELRPSDFTNDPFVIAQNDRMVSINSALAVDLTGQVAADTLGGRFFSGIGGQVDFIRGAARSRDGKPIIALPSTAQGGKVSRIQATLEPGAGIVTSRGDVHWVVTEYGIADLWGKTVRQRASALIEVAHPDFRPELVAVAKARKYVLPDQAVPRAELPGEEPCTVELESGTKLALRAVRISDEGALQDLFYRLSEESAYQRFHCHRRPPSHEELLRLVDPGFELGVALVATTAGESGEELIGTARYDLTPATGMAEVSLLVADPWQGQGVGTALFRRLVVLARARGVAGFTAEVLPNNARMLGVFNKSGLSVESRLDRGVYHVRMVLP